METFFSHWQFNSNFFWRNTHPKFSPGFTLIETLITITIIGVLAVAIINIVNPITELQKAYDVQRKHDLAQIQKALEIFHQDNGKYPDTENNKIKGLNGDVVEWGSSWTPYMSILPKDPSSSKNYVYSSRDGQTYYIYASLDRGGNDSQACNREGNACASLPLGASCGSSAVCNYGVSTPNVSP